jgi:hypothetical protein
MSLENIPETFYHGTTFNNIHLIDVEKLIVIIKKSIFHVDD